jgi:hypothetical protein
MPASAGTGNGTGAGTVLPGPGAAVGNRQGGVCRVGTGGGLGEPPSMGPTGPSAAGLASHYALVAWKSLYYEGPHGSHLSPRGAGQTSLDGPAYEGVVMDGSSRKPPAVGFWIAMIIVVLLVAVLLWIGIPVLAQFLGQAWDRLFGQR